MRQALGFGVVSILIGACASAPAPPPSAAAIVIPPAAPSAPVDPALKSRADAAVTATANKLHDIGVACREDWLETSAACKASDFEAWAKDYQAYYGERPDPRHDEGRIDSLTRLGGPDRTVEQILAGVIAGCEDNCRTQRNDTIADAVNEASEQCKKAKSGMAACKALEKKLARNVRESEVERWTGYCTGRCEDFRDHVRREAAIDAQRPRTKAEQAACEKACQVKHGGGWCGTDLLACEGRCVTLREVTRIRRSGDDIAD